MHRFEDAQFYRRLSDAQFDDELRYEEAKAIVAQYEKERNEYEDSLHIRQTSRNIVTGFSVFVYNVSKMDWFMFSVMQESGLFNEVKIIDGEENIFVGDGFECLEDVIHAVLTKYQDLLRQKIKKIETRKNRLHESKGNSTSK